MVYLKADSFVETTREADPEDEWDRDDTHTEWSFGNILTDKGCAYDVGVDYLCKQSLKKDDLEKGKQYLVVVFVWDTADSFGVDTNYHASVVYIGEPIDGEPDYDTLLFDYQPWCGYFESLSYEEVILATYI